MAHPRPLYIFDLDGTLAEATARRARLGRTPDAAAREAFDADGTHEQPVPAVARTLHLLRAGGAELLVMTGRSDAYRDGTVRWLVEHAGFTATALDGRLLMRPAGDRTPDARLKREWFERLAPEDRDRLVGVFEDRARVVDMWRALGLVCFQVAPGKF